MLLDVFIKGDVYIDYPFEDAKFRYEKQTGKVYRRFYGEAEDEIVPSSDLYNQAIRVGKQITRDEYFRDFIGNALAKLKRLVWQEAEQRAQNLKTSARAQQALDGVATGTSAVSAASRDRLREGLDGLCIDTGWTGLMVAWLECLLREEAGPGAHTSFTADELVTHYLQDCLPLANVISGCPVLDASEQGIPPGLPLAMIRQDATLVFARSDAAQAAWLRTCAAGLGMENLVVAGQAVEERRDITLFQEIISRNGAPARTVLESTQHRMALGGRWYLLRARFDAAEVEGLPEYAEFVQAIAIPTPGLEAPRQILHIATGVSPMSAVPVLAESQQPAPAPRENKIQFSMEMAFSKVPSGILHRLKQEGSRQAIVYLVLYEDVYETAFGDGCFWYPQAAFWTENDARIFLQLRLAMESERPENQLGYKYRLKEIRFSADETDRKLAATPDVEEHEHYSVEDVVRLLAGRPENPH
jgi:16S rRNA G527 N7-methylase RsmG